MARYDYKCTRCGNVFEVTHGMTERPEVTCPACGGACEKLFNAASIEFKGSGFYNTDQRGGTGATSATMGTGSEGGAGDGAAAAAARAAATAAKGEGGAAHSCENCPHKSE